MSSSSHQSSSGVGYLVTLAVLLVLTALSVAMAQVPLGDFAPVVALGIAAVKGLFVAAVFMHLRDAPFQLRFIGAVTAVFIALLCLGIALDVVYR